MHTSSFPQHQQPPPFTSSPTTATIVTDASIRGFGAWGAAPDGGPPELQGFWAPADHVCGQINLLELRAVLLAPRANRGRLAGMSVHPRTDNTCALQVVNKHASRPPAIMAGYRDLYRPPRTNSMSLRAAHIDTVSNWRADGLSRAAGATEFGYPPALRGLGERRWRRQCTVDRLASPQHHQPPPDGYNSRWATNGEAPPAWTIKWDGFSWFTPPLALLTDTLTKIREDQGRGLLLAPEWPAQPWWPLLQRLQRGSLLIDDLESFLVRHPNNAAAPEVTKNRRWTWRLWLVDSFSNSSRALERCSSS